MTFYPNDKRGLPPPYGMGQRSAQLARIEDAARRIREAAERIVERYGSYISPHQLDYYFEVAHTYLALLDAPSLVRRESLFEVIAGNMPQLMDSTCWELTDLILASLPKPQPSEDDEKVARKLLPCDAHFCEVDQLGDGRRGYHNGNCPAFFRASIAAALAATLAQENEVCIGIVSTFSDEQDAAKIIAAIIAKLRIHGQREK